MSTLFQVVILAGGLATRMLPHTQRVPKSLLKINNKPFIVHQLELLQKNGIEEVLICVGHLGEQIIDYLGNGKQFALQISYSADGPALLGTAGAIKNALPLLNENFFVLYGDSYLPCDYQAVQHVYINKKKPALMTVLHNQNQWDTSNVEFNNGNIIQYDKLHSTDRMQYIDYGLGVFSQQAFTHIFPNQFSDLALLYQNLLKQNKLAAYEIRQRFYEIGSLAGIKELEHYLQQNLLEVNPNHQAKLCSL